MKKVLIVTGFLGAGKTTFMNKLIEIYRREQIKVIVNEFGSVGMDGSLMKELHVDVEEITQGSIFCACKIDQFEKTLAKVMREDKQFIIVETSGLSDTTKARDIICNKEMFGEIEYSGCICLIDAMRFHKVVGTALVVAKQIKMSDLIIINKADLVTNDYIRKIEIELRNMNKQAAIYTTKYGEISHELRDNIYNIKLIEADFGIYTNVITNKKYTILFKSSIDKSMLENILEKIKICSDRIKGFVKLEDGEYIVNCVGIQCVIKRRIEHNPNQICSPSQLVVLSSGNKYLSKVMGEVESQYAEVLKVIK